MPLLQHRSGKDSSLVLSAVQRKSGDTIIMKEDKRVVHSNKENIENNNNETNENEEDMIGIVVKCADYAAGTPEAATERKKFHENHDENIEDDDNDNVVESIDDYEDFWQTGEDYKDYERIELFDLGETKKNIFESCFTFCSHNNNKNEIEDEQSMKNDLFTSLDNMDRDGGIIPPNTVTLQQDLGINRGMSEPFEPDIYQESPRHALTTLSAFADGSSSSSKSSDSSSDSTVVAASMMAPSRKVKFAPAMSLIPIKPLQCVSEKEKKEIWWQDEDYEFFKLEIVSLCRASVEEPNPSSLWMFQRYDSSKPEKTGKNIIRHTKQTPPKTVAIHPQQQEQKKKKKSCGMRIKSKRLSMEKHKQQLEQELEQPWYKKYGESQRGIEKICSEGQAEEIIVACKRATNIVLKEQLKQRLIPFGFGRDEEKISQLYITYNSWARDLALAAAASDADAVLQDFDDTKRKTREYFLIKQIYSNKKKIHRKLPPFMMPGGFIPKGYINEHECNVIPLKKNISMSCRDVRDKSSSNNITITNNSGSSNDNNDNNTNNNENYPRRESIGRSRTCAF